MTISADEMVILFKKEDVYGTDPTPVAGTNALLTTQFSISPFEANRVDRDLDVPGQAASPALLAGRHARAEFRLEAVGSGTAGTAPAFADVLLSCQYAETVTVDTDVQYDPVSADYDSGTLYFYNDGHLYKVSGCRGTLGLEMNAGQIPYFTCNLMGLYTRPAAGAMVEPDLTSFQVPDVVEYDTTPVATLNAVDMEMLSFSLSQPSNVNFRNLPNQKQMEVAGKRNYSSRMTVLAPAIATWNPYTLMEGHTLVALAIEHGASAGKKVGLDAAKTQIVGITLGEDNGARTYQLDLLHTADDDADLKITFS